MRGLAISVIILTLIMANKVMSQEPVKSPHGKLKWECSDCHTTESWTTIKPTTAFKHDDTGFPLLGAHQSISCDGCHKDMKLSNVGSSCVDCHSDIHLGQFGHSCENCHLSSNWQDHKDLLGLHASRGFPLVGVHEVADCRACHVNQDQNEYAGTPVDCEGCHRENFMATNNPNHMLAGFKSDCRSCHQSVSVNWQNATYQHPGAFILHGAHARLQCINCHATTYAGTSSECNGCHANDYQTSTNPPHASLGFPTDCSICHNDIQWQGATFDHVRASGFALVGAHANLHCGDCHVNNRYTGIPTDCFGCHLNDFNGAANPNHITNNFDHDCTICHTNQAWSPVTFDHTQLGFPLTGAHATLQCVQCHTIGYQNTPANCFSCHQNDFNGATDPNHVSNNFSHDCTQCHSMSAWNPATFDHSQTHFPLTGAHVGLQCIACHANGYQNTPYDCYSCHVNDFNGVTDPNHVTNNFGHDCTQCHSTSDWNPATFDHSQTHFPLTGAHVGLQCIACHANGYQNTPYDCYSCHVIDFNGVADPNHVQLNFSHDCSQCHTTSAWDPATFDHSQTPFPLTGAHISVPCLSCHANGYQNTPTDCYACHTADYDGAGNPNHQGMGFPTNCTMCHNTSGWSPSSFNHDAQYFPIFSGSHQGRWTLCSDCHLNPNDYSSFTCITCHTRPNTDSEHQGVPGYVYDSQACYSCHPTGGGGGILRNNR